MAILIRNAGWRVLRCLGFLSRFCAAVSLIWVISDFTDFRSAHATSGANPFVVVTDIDDTIKITEVTDPLSMIYNGIWGRDTFPGMAELLQGLNAEASAVVYLSEAPQFTLPWVQDLLRSMQFPLGNLQFCNWTSWQCWNDFKKSKLLELSSQPHLRESSFLMIGDDTRQDPEIYLKFKSLAWDRQKEAPIYVHRVTGRDIPESNYWTGILPYYTAFEVALSEMVFGRLSEQQVIRVGKAILDSGRLDLVIPSFAICPEEFSYPEESLEHASLQLEEVAQQLKNSIQRFCEIRKKGEGV